MFDDFFSWDSLLSSATDLAGDIGDSFEFFIPDGTFDSVGNIFMNTDSMFGVGLDGITDSLFDFSLPGGNLPGMDINTLLTATPSQVMAENTAGNPLSGLMGLPGQVVGWAEDNPNTAKLLGGFAGGYLQQQQRDDELKALKDKTHQGAYYTKPTAPLYRRR